MKLSTRGSYGTRAMLYLALHYDEGPIQLKEIARTQAVSERYLEHLIIALKVAGMVNSTRGARGGFVLARNPSLIKISEIVQVLEGSLSPMVCIEEPGSCLRSTGCVTRDLWTEMKMAMVGVLETTTLQNLVERYKAKEQSLQATYNI
ncbi:MAG: Rrf2 family transcriptional regulator [Dehalococcoidia bacterium]|nr:Rrf2 family transcriptional regulator [Dehalococcoidia bacterium]MDZ4245632.1 Rrf2 family transcriptional regulator [Dehalococcoidia bacterium]